LERSFESAATIADRASGPVSEHLGSFVELLIRQQFVAAVVCVKALHAAAFDCWLAQHDVDQTEVSEAHIEQFLRRRRRCRGPVRTETRRREEYDIQHLLGFLRSRGVCGQAVVISTAVETLAAAFALHLHEQQGLASPTIERYTIAARQFLKSRFGDGAVDMRSVVASDIIEFIRRQSAHLQPPGLKCVVTAMRSFLRFGQYLGDVAAELVAAVPAVATWATTPALPRAISPDHAQRAIASCDLGTAIGLRDRAILLILARLGLRANEVITLQLGDCDWDRGYLRVRSKGGRECVLPLPDDVGSAIAAYLEHGRPVGDDRHLFLRSTAPICGFKSGSDGIGSIVKYALARAGVDAPHRGSHQFRHALAVQMLRGGASFAEIGEVLRHRSPQTTSIYARVDIDALRPLALPWPGGAQ
jgi:site-specific recombinase XerD